MRGRRIEDGVAGRGWASGLTVAFLCTGSSLVRRCGFFFPSFCFLFFFFLLLTRSHFFLLQFDFSFSSSFLCLCSAVGRDSGRANWRRRLGSSGLMTAAMMG
jgi:hypothetical protein